LRNDGEDKRTSPQRQTDRQTDRQRYSPGDLIVGSDWAPCAAAGSGPNDQAAILHSTTLRYVTGFILDVMMMQSTTCQ